ncbi:hypothetical protein Pmar_PMAR011653 [Perkinsus marinus ATCC 50983]|uniref:Uncharacterized protein n=1 Tax=Perkinsus marinus (strain ATCC 50983 / TXsc) TaxID=423536 RepID=C5LCE2_PERM5|nr:hypothetical protein Pmar_PMAR011653 [Perkinsus marinus ATCC 50983]EER05625.1 hypothetical protein Pmar_PMAR011653 [Perkinsus marinus ATCC 50983]|eukprot:XP_002773809.1 hypothetical protein Pmar_PMAR011653 [Perkinsus marinus ATCC 50983]
MPELIDKDNAESQLLQAPPGRRGGMRGRGASAGGPSTSTNRNHPFKQHQQQYDKSATLDRKFDSQSGNKNYTKDNFVDDRTHQRPSTGSGRRRDAPAPTGGEGLNKFTLGDIRKAESTIEKSSMTVGEYVEKVARGEISGDASPAKRGGLAMNSIFDQVSTGKGSNRMSEWLKPRKEQPAGIDIAEQRKLKDGLPKGAVTLEELERGAKPAPVAARDSGDGSNDAGRALLAMIGGGGGGGVSTSSNGRDNSNEQSGMGNVHDETLRILREQQRLRSQQQQHGHRENADKAEQMKRLQRQLAQVRTKGQVSPTSSGNNQHVSPRRGSGDMSRAADSAYGPNQATHYAAQHRAALSQGSRGVGNMPASAAVIPPPPMGVYGRPAPPVYGGMLNRPQQSRQEEMQMLLQQLQQQQMRQEQQYDPHQMARRQQHQQMAATAAAAAAATRGQRGGFQPQQPKIVVDEMPLPSGLLISSRVALKSTSSFSSVLQQFARTAVSKEKGGISGAWTQLMDPLPQRGETNMARGEKLGEVDLKWLEELKKRRSVDSSPASRGDDGGSAGQREEVELESEPWVQQTLEETNVRAGEMGLFAYPAASSRWTRFPLASMGMLLAVLGVSAELSYMMTKQGEEGDELTMTSIRNRAERAVDYVYTMAVEKDDNLKVVDGALTSLVTCSLLHPEGDSSRASRLVSGALLLTTGAIMERLYGPVRYLGVVTAVTAISNFVGLQLSGTELPLLGSSPAVFFGAGYLGMLRPFSMWACLPNIPIPCLWLMAPITVSLTTRAW